MLIKSNINFPNSGSHEPESKFNFLDLKTHSLLNLILMFTKLTPNFLLLIAGIISSCGSGKKLEAANSQNADLQSQNSQLSSQNSQLNGDVNTLKKQVSDLTTQNQTITKQFNS